MLDEDTDEGIRADIFNRINSTGKKLTPAEIRKGSYLNNSFYEFILSCVMLNEFSSLFSSAREVEKQRGEKEELITRFFAYSENYQKFEHSVKGFLDDYIKEKGKTFNADERINKQRELIETLNFVAKYFPFGFRKSMKSKSIPRVRFEAIAVGVNLALKDRPILEDPDLRWLESKEFREFITSGSSNNRTKLVGRIEFVKDCLLSIDKVNSLTYEN